MTAAGIVFSPERPEARKRRLKGCQEPAAGKI